MYTISRTEKVFGILQLSSKNIYKTNNPTTIMKYFTPYMRFDYEFLVMTKKLLDLNDYYVVIHDIHFDEERKKYIGTVLEYICKVIEIPDTLNIPKLIAICNWAGIGKIKKIMNDYNDFDLTPEREIFEGDIYSIDPVGCVDIDDAIQYYYKEEKHYFIIHIADVSSYISPDSPLDIELSERCESVYLNDITIHMIPEEISIKKCSLFEGEEKRAFSVVIIVDNIDEFKKDKIEVKIIKTKIKVKQNLSYDKAQEIINKKENNSLTVLYNFGKCIGNFYNNKDDYDTHIMIANYMILANNLVADQLANYEGSLLRKHTGENIECDLSDDKNLLNIYKNLFMDRAEYILNDFKKETKHFGLNIEKYTHFTSPIRRYADILVHRMLYDSIIHKKINSDMKIENLIKKINKYKKLYNDCETLSKIFNFNKDLLNKESILDFTGNIVSFDDNNIKVHLDDIDIVVTVNIIHNKLINLYNIELDKGYFKIYNKDDKEIIILKLFQKVSIKIYRQIKNIKMFQCELIN